MGRSKNLENVFARYCSVTPPTLVKKVTGCWNFCVFVLNNLWNAFLAVDNGLCDNHKTPSISKSNDGPSYVSFDILVEAVVDDDAAVVVEVVNRAERRYRRR